MKAGKHILIERIWLSLWPLLSVLTVAATGLASDMTDIDIIRTAILSLVLMTAAAFYVRMQKDDLPDIRYAKGIILAGSLVPLLLIILQGNPEVFSFWMIGGFLAAVLIEVKLGLIIFISHTLILSAVHSLKPEAIIRFLVIALLLALLSKGLSDASTFVYSSIIILSTNITLAFVLSNFIFEAEVGYDYINSFFSIAAVLTASFLLSLLYRRITRAAKPEQIIQESGAENIPDSSGLTGNAEVCAASDDSLDLQDEENTVQDNVTTQSADTDDCPSPIIFKEHGARACYEVLLQEDNELLRSLRMYSEKLYCHCKRVGELSAAAAKAANADELLSKAGGFYHEIGKIKGKNYIAEGCRLAEEHAFPARLINILKQHNIKHDRPASVEAVIVMLSDNILSTMEYISNQKDNKITYEQIIDNIFRMRMEKGTFDESGLTLKDFKVLREFYLNEFMQIID